MSGYEEKTIQRMKTAEFAEKRAAERSQKRNYSVAREIAAVVAARENALKSFAYKIAADPQFKPEDLTNSELALLLKDLNNGRLSANFDEKEFNNLLETLIDTTFFERISSEIGKELSASEVEDLQSLIKTGRIIYEKREVNTDEKQNHLDNIGELKKLEDFYANALSENTAHTASETSRQAVNFSDDTLSPTIENAEIEEEFVFDVVDEQENVNNRQDANQELEFTSSDGQTAQISIQEPSPEPKPIPAPELEPSPDSALQPTDMNNDNDDYGVTSVEPSVNEEDDSYKKVVRPAIREIAKKNHIELKEQPLDKDRPQRLSFDTFYSEQAKQENKADGNICFKNLKQAVTTDDFQTVLLAVKTAKKMGAKSIKIGKTNKTHSANMIIAASIAGIQIKGGLPLEELKDNPQIAILIERRKLRKQMHQLREALKKETDAAKQVELQKQLDAKIQEGLQMVLEKGSIDSRKKEQTPEERLERIKNIATKKHNSAAPSKEAEFAASQARLQAFVASQQGRS